MPATKEEKIQILAEAMLRDRSNEGWHHAATLEAVPDTIGHYAVYDGLTLRGAGVTHDMRRSVRDMMPLRIELPIILWLPDQDGGAELWLDGKIRCDQCKAIMEIGELDRHSVVVHDDEDTDR